VAAAVSVFVHRFHGAGDIDDDVLPLHEGGVDPVDTATLGLA
jgi:hypothetical protein